MILNYKVLFDNSLIMVPISLSILGYMFVENIKSQMYCQS